MRPLKNYIKYCFVSLCILSTLCSTNIALSQPVADFNATLVSGCSPLVVQFTDNSSGNPTAWNWDFGNGNTSTQKNPVITYLNHGTYTVKLTVSNTSGSNSITKTQYITVYDNPIVKFTVSDSFNCVPFTTHFTDLSTTSGGNTTAWEWDFDDGSTSAIKNPQHGYSQPGNYNITLKVTNSGGCFSSLSKLAYIKAADSIRTLFSFSQPTKCKPPETIRFTNSTLGPGTMSYLWNFGDGSSSTQTSVSHIYNTGGIYSVSLIVSNSLGCKDTLVYKDTVTIKNVQTAINSRDTTCVNTSTSLINATTPAPLSSRWVFSDGTTSFGATTAKTFINPGNYNVKLVSNFNTCSDSVTKRITVLNAPVVNFSALDSTSCKPPLTVNFNNLSTGAVNWSWDFGDGLTAASQSPSHTYTSEGEFNVKLSATSSGGCTNTLTQFRFIRITKPVVRFDTAEGGGCIPYIFKPYPVVSSVDGIAAYLWDFGNGHSSAARFPTEIYTDSGTYTVKLQVLSNDGCIDSAVTVGAVRTGNHPLVNFSAGASVICPGTNVLFTDSSAPADRWEWHFSDGTQSTAQNPSHQFSDSGKYSIKLIAWNNGCKDSLTQSKIIRILPGLARFTPVYNCNNKKEVYFKDSSILPQSWFWDFGDGSTSTQQNPTHQFANYQTYNVSLTTTYDSCTNTKTIPVTTVNEMPDFVVSKNALCRSDSTFFSFQNFNKNNIASYKWDFGDGVITSTVADSVWHTYRSAGAFTVKLMVTDIYNCSETISKQNYIHVFAPQAGFTINAAGGCQNKAVNFTDTSNGQNGNHNIAKWVWDFGDGITQTYTAPLPSPLPHIYASTGFFYPSLKITDSIGCPDSISYAVPIGIYQPVANFFSPNYNTCINDSVILHNLSTGKRLSYLWSFGDGNISTDSLPLKQYTANGNYTMKLVVTDMYGCKDSLSKINYINVKTVIAAFRVSDSIGICTPFKVNFTNTSTNSLSQVWDFGDGGLSSTANPVYYYTSPGTYYAKLTAKRSNGCYSSDSIKIKISAPSGTLDYVPQSGCAPLNVSFHAATKDSVSFTWDFNDGTSFTSFDTITVHTYQLPGNFIPSVILKDSKGCIIPVIGKDTIKLYSSKVNFGANDNIFCNEGTVNFSDSSFSASNIISYNWDFGDSSSSALQNPSHHYSRPELYTVKLTVSTVNGCRDSLVKPNYIKVFTTPNTTISGNNASYCGPSLITMQGNWLNADTSTMYWRWSFGNGNTSLLQNPPAQQYTDIGIYAVQLIATNSSGCADTAINSIMINPVPNTLAGNDTVICLGSTAQLQVSGADSYTWQPAVFLSCISCSNPVSNSRSDIRYFIKGTNSYGCEKTDSILIIVKQPFHITGLQNADSVCTGQAIQLNVGGAENYSWSPAEGLNNVTINNPLAKPATSITYKVTGSDSSNCFKDSASIFIKVNPVPSVNAGADIIINSGRTVTLIPVYSPDVTSWLWQPAAGLSCNNCPNPDASPTNSTMYKVTVTNSSGCTDSNEVFVRVNCNKNSIFLPTGFSPNNDEQNDFFYPLNSPGAGSIKISRLTVYDRYGQVVFDKGNFNSNDKKQGWNGRFKGRECPAGAYIYTISFVCGNEQLVSFGGNILLVR